MLARIPDEGHATTRRARTPMNQSLRPTHVRYAVLLATTLTSFVLYLDRVCIAEIVKADAFKSELHLGPDDVGKVLSSFFFGYGLAQVPSGWLADRFGARGMMTFYVALWSVFTALTGFVHGLVALVVVRVGFGFAQAGAYPTSGGLLSRWIPFPVRGLASSVVTFGGRCGGAVAPWLTALLIVELQSWRLVLLVFSLAGIAVSAAFWFVFRERPAVHPLCNAAECDLIEKSRPATATSPHGRAHHVPWRELFASRSLWLMCLSQCCTNIGWAFLITWLPTYLKEAQHVDPVTGGKMASTALFVGMSGMIFGGWLTDAATRRLGARWGRALPLAGSRYLAAGAYVSCLWLDSPWALTAAFALVAFATDIGLPASWAYMQDVGGRHVGSILGWPNMWGNLGAFATAGLLPWVNRTFDANHDWHEAFLVCAGAFVISGTASLGIDATKPVVKDVE